MDSIERITQIDYVPTDRTYVTAVGASPDS